MSPGPTHELAPLVLQAVTETLADPAITVRMDSRFRDDLGFDSVKFMQVIHRVEQLVHGVGELALPDMISSMETVGTLVGYLGDRLLTVTT